MADSSNKEIRSYLQTIYSMLNVEWYAYLSLTVVALIASIWSWPVWLILISGSAFVSYGALRMKKVYSLRKLFLSLTTSSAPEKCWNTAAEDRLERVLRDLLSQGWYVSLPDIPHQQLEDNIRDLWEATFLPQRHRVKKRPGVLGGQISN